MFCKNKLLVTVHRSTRWPGYLHVHMESAWRNDPTKMNNVKHIQKCSWIFSVYLARLLRINCPTEHDWSINHPSPIRRFHVLDQLNLPLSSGFYSPTTHVIHVSRYKLPAHFPARRARQQGLLPSLFFLFLTPRIHGVVTRVACFRDPRNHPGYINSSTLH